MAYPRQAGYGYPQNGAAVYQPTIEMPMMPNQNFISGLKGRPVSSIEEVRAAQIDFDGSLFVFPDIANKRIYTKQINIDGTASLNMYELKPLPQTIDGALGSAFVTREEFDAAIKNLREALSQGGTATDPVTAKPVASAAVEF